MNPVSAKVIEECSELIQAICKAEEHGWNNWHPDHPEITNIDQVQNEIQDVKRAISKLQQLLP